MPAYIIGDVRDAWDREALEEYRRRNTATVTRRGGRFIVRGGEVASLEGDWDTRRIVVIEFPDLATAREWYESDDYEPLKALRQSASDTNIILVDGVQVPAPLCERVQTSAGSEAAFVKGDGRRRRSIGSEEEHARLVHVLGKRSARP